MRIILVLLLGGCGADTRAPGPGDGDGVTPPPRDATSVAAWLATGEYLTWRCEDAPHPARPGSGHSNNRICNNELVATTASGTAFPVGAASVKELLDSSDQIVGLAFVEKAGPSDGGRGWYWYEVIGQTQYAASYGATLCTGCHEKAHDFLFTVVR
jgi:hypothetical protein